MLNNQVRKYEKPQERREADTRGKSLTATGSSNSTTILRESKSRHDRGMELYKAGRVSIGVNGFFKVSGFNVDTEKMQCECPDYKTRKEPCKHIYASCLFVKNRGKVKIEGLSSNPKTELKDIANKSAEAPGKPFDRQATINH